MHVIPSDSMIGCLSLLAEAAKRMTIDRSAFALLESRLPGNAASKRTTGGEYEYLADTIQLIPEWAKLTV